MLAHVFLAEGFEEVEAVTIVDVLRRGGLTVKTVATGKSRIVTGAHQIPIQADLFLAEAQGAELLVLPGGMPGTKNLGECEPLKELILKHEDDGKRFAAICAAPSVLGQLGLLRGKKATCYPGFESMLEGAEVVQDAVVVDGQVVTSRGVGTALAFSLKLVELTMGGQKASELKKALLVE